MRVDLFTHDRALEAQILEDFSGKITEEQHTRDTTDKPILYCFYNLEHSQIRDFLKGKNFEYELRDSETGKIVGVSERVGQEELN